MTFKNCRFYGLEATAKTMGITLSCDTKLIVEGCFFGKCGEKLYNFFELNGKLADGSYISNNYCINVVFFTVCYYCTSNFMKIIIYGILFILMQLTDMLG